MNSENTPAVSPLDETAHVVAAYVSNNRVAEADLTALISSVFSALMGVTSGAKAEPEPAPLVPAVSVKKSITDDYITCLEDGKKFKSLKRHLMTHFDLTPEAYRAKWSLPTDYPMVAPNYAAARSALAKTWASVARRTLRLRRQRRRLAPRRRWRRRPTNVSASRDRRSASR